MAHILPESLPQALPIEVLKTFRVLKTLPDTFFIWHHLAPWQLNTPDFLMITQKGCALLVKVSSSSAAQAISAAQLLLLDDNRPPLGAAEAEVLSSFIKKLDIPDNTPIKTLTIFPNIPHKQVLESRIVRQDNEPEWAGKELLSSDSGLKWEDYFLPTPVDKVIIEKIRQQFTPEIVVPAEMTVCPSNPRRIQAGLQDYLLDYDQEAAVKIDLDIEPEGQNLSTDFRLNIVNGVAGSGKTLILLYRLRLLYHLYPDKQFLVLTHNKPLSHDLQSRFARLEGTLPARIEWCTFNGWCYSHWPKHPAWKEPLSIRKREEVVHQVWGKTLQNSTITEHMLISEIDWLKDQLPIDQSEYITIDRRGRGFGLTADQRIRMWNAVNSYRQLLNNKDHWIGAIYHETYGNLVKKEKLLFRNMISSSWMKLSSLLQSG